MPMCPGLIQRSSMHSIGLQSLVGQFSAPKLKPSLRSVQVHSRPPCMHRLAVCQTADISLTPLSKLQSVQMNSSNVRQKATKRRHVIGPEPVQATSASEAPSSSHHETSYDQVGLTHGSEAGTEAASSAGAAAGSMAATNAPQVPDELHSSDAEKGIDLSSHMSDQSSEQDTADSDSSQFVIPHEQGSRSIADVDTSDRSSDSRDEQRSPPAETISQGTTFKQLGVDSRLSGKLREKGITEATPVQLAAIPRILEGADVAVQSYTGSGKTLAYLLPVLTDAIARAEVEGRAAQSGKGKGRYGTLQAVVVAPSRELAMQIVRVAHSLLPPASRGAVQQCIGGANPHRQAEAVHANRPVMVVGTPGRLAELSRNGVLATHLTGTLVLDEVDQLLESHFREDLGRLLEHTGKRCANGRQTVLVSATLTPAVLAACSAWCPNLVSVSVTPASPGAQNSSDWDSVGGHDSSSGRNDSSPGPAMPSTSGTASVPEGRIHRGWEASVSLQSESVAAIGSSSSAGRALPPNVDHSYVVSDSRHKVDTLRRCIYATEAQRLLVFMNFQQRLKDTAHKLSASGMSVGCLHGELGKLERQTILNRFRNGKLRVLVVSDVAARGLDVADCDAVFNLELPSDAAAYAHRAGRTARMGRQGTMVSVVSPAEAFVVPKLGRQLGITIPQGEVTEGRYQLLSSPARQSSVVSRTTTDSGNSDGL